MITALISGKNLLHNIFTLQSLALNSKLVIMVKANAYGHGIYKISQYLENNLGNNLYALGVARIDEAILLRNKGIKAPILLAEGIFKEDELLIALKQNFWVMCHNSQQLSWIQNFKFPNKINIWLKLRTQMNRLGFNLEDAQNAYNILSNHPDIIKPIVVASHFACADELLNPINNLQINEFQKFTNNLPVLKSLNNSAAIINFPQTNFDIIRAGIAIYGASPVQNKTAFELNLKPVMTLKSKIIAIHNLKTGETIGYGARFKCKKDTKIAIIAAGYGDGYSRTITDGAPVLINNKKCQIAGRVSMDMISVSLENCPDAKIGDLVTLWGKGLPVEEISKFSSCVSYDLFCGVQNRVEYVWID